MGRAVEKVLGGMGGCPAGGTEVIWGPAHPHQETVEGRAEARAELGECRAVRAGEGGFLSRHPRVLVLQEYVILEGAHRPGDSNPTENNCLQLQYNYTAVMPRGLEKF